MYSRGKFVAARNGSGSLQAASFALSLPNHRSKLAITSDQKHSLLSSQNQVVCARHHLSRCASQSPIIITTSFRIITGAGSFV